MNDRYFLCTIIETVKSTIPALAFFFGRVKQLNIAQALIRDCLNVAPPPALLFLIAVQIPRRGGGSRGSQPPRYKAHQKFKPNKNHPIESLFRITKQLNARVFSAYYHYSGWAAAGPKHAFIPVVPFIFIYSSVSAVAVSF
jgi:hypothetical protein